MHTAGRPDPDDRRGRTFRWFARPRAFSHADAGSSHSHSQARWHRTGLLSCMMTPTVMPCARKTRVALAGAAISLTSDDGTYSRL